MSWVDRHLSDYCSTRCIRVIMYANRLTSCDGTSSARGQTNECWVSLLPIKSVDIHMWVMWVRRSKRRREHVHSYRFKNKIVLLQLLRLRTPSLTSSNGFVSSSLHRSHVMGNPIWRQMARRACVNRSVPRLMRSKSLYSETIGFRHFTSRVNFPVSQWPIQENQVLNRILYESSYFTIKSVAKTKQQYRRLYNNEKWAIFLGITFVCI